MNIRITFKWLAIGLVCLLLISTLVSCGQPSPTPTPAAVAPVVAPVPNLTAEEYFLRGNDYAFQGQHEKAIQDYDEAIRLNPQFADAYYNRGTAYGRDLGQYGKAIKDFDEAIRLNPHDADAYYNRGAAYAKLGQQEQADRDFAKAKELGYE